MFSLSIYLFNNVPHRLTFLIRVFSFPSYGTTTTTGAQPPTRPSSAIAAKAIPVQTKPWHWNVAAHPGNATTTTPKKMVRCLRTPTNNVWTGTAVPFVWSVPPIT